VAASRPSAAGPVAEIARGLRSGEFTAHYQPIIGLADGRVHGFEALVRWNHPKQGLLLPGAFLGEVERGGLLGQLDSLVLRTACQQAVRFDPRHSGPYISVNASVAQLLDQDFPGLVHSALTAASLPPWRLMIEVTETASLQDPAAVADVLSRLREQRVRIAFDDFGTGYSSLSWLQQLPLDVVKIDKSFVDRLPHVAGERPVVEALVKLAQTLGLGVIAEGVETDEQGQLLRAMGVELAQGWLFSRAVPAADAALLLSEGPNDRLFDGRLVLRSG
jgi:EAL domain-containing protein (putative c-di-GMP-specific phosphodiesterase class I)